MMFMNESEVLASVARHYGHPVLGPATRFLESYMQEVNSHSDGWPYWSPPVRAAAKLMALIKRGEATKAELTKALSPIKSFMTRRGLAAGMKMPSIEPQEVVKLRVVHDFELRPIADKQLPSIRFELVDSYGRRAQLVETPEQAKRYLAYQFPSAVIEAAA